MFCNKYECGKKKYFKSVTLGEFHDVINSQLHTFIFWDTNLNKNHF